MNDGWRMACAMALLAVLIGSALLSHMTTRRGNEGLSPDEQRLVLQLARRQLEMVLAGKGEIEVDRGKLSPVLSP
jgi:hypothetical protein